MSSIFRSFTFTLSVFVLVIASLTAMTIYNAETSSVVQAYANGGAAYTLTKAEAARFQRAALWYFVTFSCPVIPLIILRDKRSSQIAVAVVSVLVLVTALTATPGGDFKGCEDCFIPVLFSGATTLLFFLISSLWIGSTFICQLFDEGK